MSRSAGPTSKARSRAERKACSVYRVREKRHCRLVITEARIDALSVAAIKGVRADTLYAATGGGMGPGTVQAIEHLLGPMAQWPGALLAGATDANRAGERYAARQPNSPPQAALPSNGWRRRPVPTGMTSSWNGDRNDFEPRLGIAALRTASGSSQSRPSCMDRPRSFGRSVAHLTLGRVFGLGPAIVRYAAQPDGSGDPPGIARAWPDAARRAAGRLGSDHPDQAASRTGL